MEARAPTLTDRDPVTHTIRIPSTDRDPACTLASTAAPILLRDGAVTVAWLGPRREARKLQVSRWEGQTRTERVFPALVSPCLLKAVEWDISDNEDPIRHRYDQT